MKNTFFRNLILGAALGAALPSLAEYSAKQKELRITMKRLESSLDRFRLDCNVYPGYAEGGLGALLPSASAVRTCAMTDKQGYVTQIPRDPWGREFYYQATSKDDYRLLSLGADGKLGGTGDDADFSSDE